MASDRQGLLLLIQDADDAQVEPKLLDEQFHNVVEAGLQVHAAGHYSGSFMQHIELLSTGFMANGNGTENVENLFQFATLGREVIFDNDACRSRSDRAGQFYFNKTLETWKLIFRQASLGIDLFVLEIFGNGRSRRFLSHKLGHQLDESRDRVGLGQPFAVGGLFGSGKDIHKLHGLFTLDFALAAEQ